MRSSINESLVNLNYRYNQLTEKMLKIFIFTLYPITILFFLFTAFFNALPWQFLITSSMIVFIIESIIAFQRKKLMTKRDALSKYYETISETRMQEYSRIMIEDNERVDRFLASIPTQPECHCVQCGKLLDFNGYLRWNINVLDDHGCQYTAYELLTIWTRYHDVEIKTNGKFGLICCSCHRKMNNNLMIS